MLATVLHETGGEMQPVEEVGKGAGRPYGKNLNMIARYTLSRIGFIMVVVMFNSHGTRTTS